jgi:predicted DNA-binding transcriptional regulator YafY
VSIQGQTSQASVTATCEEKRLVTITLTATEAAHLMIAARADRNLGREALRALDTASDKLQRALAAIEEASPIKVRS